MVRNLVIEMDRDPNVYPDTNHIQWTADPRWSNYNILGAYVTPPPAGDNTASGTSSSNGSSPLDGFNITRTGDVATPLRITIQINHVPERIKLSPHLANILGVQEDTRQNIFGSFWHYVKANGLQDKNDRKLIRLDEKLRSVFKYESLNFQDIQALLAAHMHTADPIVLTYEVGTHCTDSTVSNADGSSADITMQDGTAMSGVQPGGIGVGKDGKSAIKSFDIELDMDDVWMRSKAGDVIMSMQPEAVTVGSGTTAPPSGTFLAIQKADDEIKSNMQVLRSLRTRRDFFQALADKPASFIQNFVESQARDLEVILGNERAAEGGGAGGNISVGSGTGVRETDLMDSEFFQGDWVYEAVGVYEGMRMNHAVSAMHQAQQANLQNMQAMQHSGQVPMRG
ncbi:hypothetical protein CPB86DRAFT_415798 [Serendipita vermifera]|nr:hypothetical protein CPB86DRAFT_415798 [Serendipita vermifera]